MVIAKQIEIRDNIKKYFDLAYEGDSVIVPRKENKNVVIISEMEYTRLKQAKRLDTYTNLLRTDASGNVRDDNLKKLHMISKLGDDWNQNGAPAFSDILIAKLRSIINKLDIQPEIFPTALGTIQLEYDNSRHDHMEIEVGESDLAEVFVALFSKKEYFESIPSTVSSINKRVKEFYG